MYPKLMSMHNRNSEHSNTIVLYLLRWFWVLSVSFYNSDKEYDEYFDVATWWIILYDDIESGDYDIMLKNYKYAFCKRTLHRDMLEMFWIFWIWCCWIINEVWIIDLHLWSCICKDYLEILLPYLYYANIMGHQMHSILLMLRSRLFYENWYDGIDILKDAENNDMKSNTIY